MATATKASRAAHQRAGRVPELGRFVLFENFGDALLAEAGTGSGQAVRR